MKRDKINPLRDLKEAILETENLSPLTKEEYETLQKLNNEALFGLYMTDDEALELLSKGFQFIHLWDYKTHSFHQYGVPNEWKISICCADMSQIVNCAGCGKELPYGETYTSLERHSFKGFGYGVCNECYEKEWKRRSEAENNAKQIDFLEGKIIQNYEDILSNKETNNESN